MTRKSVLIVDDERAIRTVTANFLAEYYDVTVKPNVYVAMSWLMEGHRVDAIVSDLYMPGMNGFDFLGHLRSFKDTAFWNVPVLMLSGTESSEDRIRCFKLGADDFILKPFNPMELQVRIESVLRRLGETMGAEAFVD